MVKYIIGTSGFFYRERKGKFYPEDLSYSKWLEYYAKYFNGLEVNSSFYRFPSKSTLRNFTKIDLNYIFKVNRLFTHYRKVDKERITEFLGLFDIFTKDSLGKLKGFLFQFPRLKKSECVDDFVKFVLELIKIFRKFDSNTDYFIEFRDNRIFEEIEKYKDEFIKNNSYIICVDGKFRGYEINFFKDLGGDKAYFRFHGKGEKLYDRFYTEEELKIFVEKIKSICKDKKDCFIFFNNTVRAQAVFNAIKLKDLLWK